MIDFTMKDLLIAGPEGPQPVARLYTWIGPGGVQQQQLVDDRTVLISVPMAGDPAMAHETVRAAVLDVIRTSRVMPNLRVTTGAQTGWWLAAGARQRATAAARYGAFNWPDLARLVWGVLTVHDEWDPSPDLPDSSDTRIGLMQLLRMPMMSPMPTLAHLTIDPVTPAGVVAITPVTELHAT